MEQGVKDRGSKSSCDCYSLGELRREKSLLPCRDICVNRALD